MRFEWDNEKAVTNESRHGVPFDYATRVFLDRDAVVIPDERRNYGEDRSIIYGMIEGRLHAVVFTMREDSCRIISARKANARERKRHGVF